MIVGVRGCIERRYRECADLGLRGRIPDLARTGVKQRAVGDDLVSGGGVSGGTSHRGSRILQPGTRQLSYLKVDSGVSERKAVDGERITGQSNADEMCVFGKPA